MPPTTIIWEQMDEDDIMRHILHKNLSSTRFLMEMLMNLVIKS